MSKTNIYLLTHFLIVWCIISHVIVPYIIRTKKKDKAISSYHIYLISVKMFSLCSLCTFIVTFKMKWEEALVTIAIGAALGIFIQTIILMKYINSSIIDKSSKEYILINCFLGYSFIILQKNILPEKIVSVSLLYLLLLNCSSLISFFRINNYSDN